jgi:7tm Odorant receptor.
MKKLTSQEAGEKLVQRLKLMDVSIKLLNITGIIPSKEICSSLWKYRIYVLCQMSSYTLYAIVVVLQVLGLYHYWGDLVITTDNIAVTGTFMIGYIPTILAMTKKEEVWGLIDYLEESSIFSFSNIRSNVKHLKIIEEAKILVSHLTWFATVSLLITIFFWSIYPLVSLRFGSETESTQNHEDLRTTFQYLVFVMLVPSDLRNPYLYGAIYLFQAITFTMALIYIIGLVPLYLSLIVYTTAQFKIVSEAINEINNALSCQQKNERLAEFAEKNALRDGKFKLFMRSRIVLPGGLCESKNKSSLVAVQRRALVYGASRQSHPASMISIYKSTNDAGAYSTIFMMVECIKLHQSAIR